MFISKIVLHGVIWIQRENVVTSPYSVQSKYAFWGEIKEMSKTNIFPSREKNALELLHQRLDRSSTKSLMDGDTSNVWGDIELGIHPNHFCTSFLYFFHEQKFRV